MTARTSVLAEVERTLTALDLADVDAAAAELCRRYARQLDTAAATERAADRALRAATEECNETLIEQVEALRAKLGEREAYVRVGARLEALLVELQATPKARAVKGQGAPTAPATGGKLGALRVAK